MKESQDKIKFYKFYFAGNPKPIIMETISQNDANYMMNELAKKSKGKIDLDLIIDTRVEVPAKGVSKKTLKGKSYTWVGLENSKNGWMLTSEFKKMDE